MAYNLTRWLATTAFGINQSALFLGGVIGPDAGGYIADYMDPRGLRLDRAACPAC